MAIDAFGETWRTVKEYAEKEIAEAHEALEVQGLEPSKTEFERGRIAALRLVLGLSAPPKPRPVFDSH